MDDDKSMFSGRNVQQHLLRVGSELYRTYPSK